MLSNSFHHKIGIGLGEQNNTALEPKCSDFISHILAKLDQSLSPLLAKMTDDSAASMATFKTDLFDNESEKGQDLQNLLDTICHWICDCLKAKNTVNCYDFAKLLPQVCLCNCWFENPSCASMILLDSTK